MPCWAWSRLTPDPVARDELGRVGRGVEVLARPAARGQLDVRAALDAQPGAVLVGERWPTAPPPGCRSPAEGRTASAARRPRPRSARRAPRAACRGTPRPGRARTTRPGRGPRAARAGRRAGAAERAIRPRASTSTVRRSPSPSTLHARSTSRPASERGRPDARADHQPVRPGLDRDHAVPHAVQAQARHAASSCSGPCVPRSLSVGARHTSSRGPSSARSPSAVSTPVAASKRPGPSERPSPPATGLRRRRGTPGAGAGVSWIWPQATSWPAGAHGSSAASTARTVSHALAARRQAASAARPRPSRPRPAVGTSSTPSATGTPSSSSAHGNARCDRSRKSCRFATRTPRPVAGDPHRLDHLLELEQPRRRRAVREHQAVGDEVAVVQRLAEVAAVGEELAPSACGAARGRSTPRRTRPGSAGTARTAPGTRPARPARCPSRARTRTG